MTQFVFAANLLPEQRYPVVLPPPWRWWQTTVYPDDRTGFLAEEQVDDWENPKVFTLSTGPDWGEVVLRHPPTLLAVTIDEYPPIAPSNPSDWVSDVRYTVVPHQKMIVRTVWHEQPGERWFPVAFDWSRSPTCMVGQYEIFQHTVKPGEREPRWDERTQAGVRPREILQWRRTPTIRDGVEVTLPQLDPWGNLLEIE